MNRTRNGHQEPQPDTIRHRSKLKRNQDEQKKRTAEAIRSRQKKRTAEAVLLVYLNFFIQSQHPAQNTNTQRRKTPINYTPLPDHLQTCEKLFGLVSRYSRHTFFLPIHH